MAKRVNTDRIVRLYQSGLSSYVIADKLGHTQLTVLRHLRQTIGVRKRVPRFNSAEICRSYVNGESSNSIARRLGCTKKNVLWYLQKCGVTMRSLKDYPRPAQDAHYNWKGGRVYARGYVRLTLPDGKYILEHRRVVETHLGRPLKAHEIVHHMNGVKDDNRIENLMIVTRPMHETDTRAKLLQARIRELEKQLRHS